MKQEGYVFISHSHQDIEKVRQIRNAMEVEGFEPLCFYLKCLTDEDEIEGLIKREIDAREWFVYVDSPNSRASAWVAKERDYISSLDSKQIVTIDLDRETDMQAVARKLVRGLRVLILCGSADEELAKRLQECFIEKDMQAFLNGDAGKTAADCSCVLVLLSEASDKSAALEQSVSEAAKADPAFISLLVDDPEPSGRWDDLLEQSKARHYLSKESSKRKLEEIVRRVETDITHDLRKAFADARSHSEVESYYLQNRDDPEAAKLAQEAQDRLDDEQRMKEDLREAVENGTMQLTDELKKFLES
ncbi:MAG: toll/interleukin-1 receptor domain-containing protein [Firmicutes bacterium]|nr:toll/interleukin-1 receptor domain-containing protein [Bacillota bacterium]